VTGEEEKPSSLRKISSLGPTVPTYSSVEVFVALKHRADGSEQFGLPSEGDPLTGKVKQAVG